MKQSQNLQRPPLPDFQIVMTVDFSLALWVARVQDLAFAAIGNLEDYAMHNPVLAKD
jgi:hypothetical protein